MNRNGILNQDALHSYNKIQTKEDEKIKKPYQTSADLTEKIILQPLRMLREFKQLLDDLFQLNNSKNNSLIFLLNGHGHRKIVRAMETAQRIIGHSK